MAVKLPVERISKHLNTPYIYLRDIGKFLCANGVLFTIEEYKQGIDLEKEYEKRKIEDTLYDYAYAKSTGKLRKKRGYAKKQEEVQRDGMLFPPEEDSVSRRACESAERVCMQDGGLSECSRELSESTGERNTLSQRSYSTADRQEESKGKSRNRNVIIAMMLAFTSVISMYISTLHTATYLTDYVDIFSAWLMSASVTAYNATAFEVSVLFHNTKRNFMAFIFMSLWIMVTLFSMATTVSIFYDQFNFQETQIAEENKAIDSNKLSLELLQKKEKDLREAIEFKKKDIEYRQEKEYATATVRKELNALQEELQNNLSEQQKLLSDTPEVTKEVLTRKESLFAFLGRLMHLEGGILEFIMSTLSAVFVNLIAPLSLSATMELSKKEIK